MSHASSRIGEFSLRCRNTPARVIAFVFPRFNLSQSSPARANVVESDLMQRDMLLPMPSRGRHPGYDKSLETINGELGTLDIT